ncbi:hypothetical protein E8E11_008834 [Didymella keratinophila]|nr:hypothetical protein E8E11_008834 [Didymella keratinophila]
MSRSYCTAVPKQLHATLPGPDGTHACLTLYDECPHTSHLKAFLQPKEPYLHCDLPALPAASSPRTIEYINEDGTRVVETTRSTLSTIPSQQSIRSFSSIDRAAKDVYDSTCNTLSSIQYPKEKAMAACLAPLVMSRHSPMMHHIRKSTADALRAQAGSSAPLRSILKPSMPTIYLLTFSTDRTPTTKGFAKLLNKHLPSGASLRYTIDAGPFLVPSRQIQELYSGVAEVTQDAVLQDRRARREVEHAVGELTSFVVGKGRETAIAVCCTAGTHRSVAIAECIAKGVRREVRRMGEGAQVKVVVRHIHRVQGPKDPY